LSLDGSIIHRSVMHEKIYRNFEMFTTCDFITTITQHIPDKKLPTRVLLREKSAESLLEDPFPDYDHDPVMIYANG